MKSITSFVFGLLFAIGLGISTIGSPDTIFGFLDIGGRWDPSLLVILTVGSSVFGVVFWIARLRAPSWVATNCILPTKTKLDARLLSGATIFGIGWGLAGLCPGVAFASLATLSGSALAFTAAMIAGFVLERVVSSLLATGSSAQQRRADARPHLA